MKLVFGYRLAYHRDLLHQHPEFALQKTVPEQLFTIGLPVRPSYSNRRETKMHQQDQYFGFEIPEALCRRVQANLKAIQDGGAPEVLNQQVAETLIDITEIGLDAYYNKPRDLVRIAPMIRKAADTGIQAVVKGTHLVIRKLFTKMPLEELQVLAQYMATLITQSDHAVDRRYYITFPLDDDLYQLSQRLLARVRQDPDVDSYREEITASLIELINVGVRAYYHEPIDKIRLGSFTRKTADLGISASQKGANAVVQRLFKIMPHQELIPLSSYFESLLHKGLKAA
jgi:hypothetical protein